jgi:hypothetical protein
MRAAAGDQQRTAVNDSISQAVNIPLLGANGGGSSAYFSGAPAAVDAMLLNGVVKHGDQRKRCGCNVRNAMLVALLAMVLIAGLVTLHLQNMTLFAPTPPLVHRYSSRHLLTFKASGGAANDGPL